MPKSLSHTAQPSALRAGPLVAVGGVLVALQVIKATPPLWWVGPGWWGFFPFDFVESRFYRGFGGYDASYATSTAVGVLIVGLASWWTAVLAQDANPSRRRVIAGAAWLMGLVSALVAMKLAMSESYIAMPAREYWYFAGVPNAIAVGMVMGVLFRQRLVVGLLVALSYVPFTAVAGLIWGTGTGYPVALSVPLVFGVGHLAVQVLVIVVLILCIEGTARCVQRATVTPEARGAEQSSLLGVLITAGVLVLGVGAALRLRHFDPAVGGSFLSEVVRSIGVGLFIGGLAQWYAQRSSHTEVR